MTGVSIDVVDDELPLRGDDAGTAPVTAASAPMSRDCGQSPSCWWFSTTVGCMR